MAYGGEAIDRPMLKEGDGPGAGDTPPVTAGADPAALTLTQLLPANPAKGWSTPYYPVYTDQGDVGAVIPGTLTAQQRVRLVDPSNGATLAEGVGNDGAQQIATLANALGQQLKGKAAYNVQVEMQPEQFSTVGGDDINHPHANFLKSLVQIAAPLLGAAIPGIGPILGAALGGFGGSLATGGDLKSALLSALTSGVGNSLGGALSGALRGVPVSFAGTNPLGGVLGHLGDALSGGAGAAAGSVAGGSGGLLSAPTNGAGGALGSTVSPLVVTAGTGGLTSALTGALGTGLGGVLPGLLGGSSGSGLTATPPRPTGPDQGTEVSPVTVTGAAPGSGVPIPGITGLGSGSSGGTGTTSPDGETPPAGSDGFFSRNNLLDLAGQTGGGLAGDAGVYGLAQLLGLFNGGGVDGSNLQAPGFDGSTDTGPVPGAPGTLPDVPGIPAAPAAAPPGASFGGPPAAAGGALGQALGVANFGTGGGATAPLAAAPSLNVRGSTAPDIWPWRGRELAGQAA